MAEAQKEKVGKQDKKEALKSRTTKTSLKIPMFVLLALFACMMSVRQFRWNVVLAIYMPLLGGYPFELMFLMPVYDAWVELELMNAHNFKNPSGDTIREIKGEDYSWDELMRVSQNMRYPVVIRGIMNDTVAAKTFGTQEFGKKYGQFILRESVAKPQFKYEYDVVERGTFQQFLDVIRTGEYRMAYGLDELYQQHPHLAEHIEMQRISKKGTDMCRSISLFASSTGEGLRWHNENHASIGTQIVGTKTWYLIDQDFVPLLGPETNGDPYSTGYSLRASKRVHEMIPQMKVTAEPGDVIFTSPWVLHRVDSVGDPESNVCFLNTCRFSVEPFSSLGGLRASPVTELYQHLGSINWLDPSLPAFMRFIPYFRVMQDNFHGITDTMSKWNDDNCFSSKGRACRDYLQARGWSTSEKNSKTR